MLPIVEKEHELAVFALNETLEIDKVILSVTPDFSKDKKKE